MIHDAACPGPLEPAAAAVEREGIFYTSAQWTPDALEQLIGHLETAGPKSLARLSHRQRLEVWTTAVESFRNSRSAESEALRPALARFSGLSGAGLGAALEAVLGGVSGGPAAKIFTAAQPAAQHEPPPAGLVAVILAGNLPALSVQPLLPALALGLPVLLKSPRSEPLFAPAFVRALCRLEPSLADAVAAITWPGGDTALERPVLERAATVLVYGEQEAVDSIGRRTRGRCVTYGPKTSLAVVAAETDPAGIADDLARDIALFDQRGCLSVQAVYTDGDPRALASCVADSLSRLAGRWPPGPIDPVAAAGVQQLRLDAKLRGLFQPEMPLASGTVVVDPLPNFRPSPGLRSVRIHPTPLEDIAALLAPWTDRLQGAALAGERAWRLETELSALGISRCAIPGQLQAADALWHNGGRHPLEVLGAQLVERPDTT